MKKLFCDVCGKELDAKTKFGGYFKYRGPNTVTWDTRWDLCEEHGEEALRFIHGLRASADFLLELQPDKELHSEGNVKDA